MTPTELADEVVEQAVERWQYFYTDKKERFPDALKVWVTKAIEKYAASLIPEVVEEPEPFMPEASSGPLVSLEDVFKKG